MDRAVNPVEVVMEVVGFLFGLFFSSMVLNFLNGMITGEGFLFSGGKFLGLIDLSSQVGTIMALLMMLSLIMTWTKFAPLLKAIIIGCLVATVLGYFGLNIVDMIISMVFGLGKRVWI